MKPTIGRIVIYSLTEYDKNSIDGNTSDVLPAIIVTVLSDTCVNLKIITDGNNDLWRTSVQQGDTKGNWNWPVIENKVSEKTIDLDKTGERIG